MSNNEEVQLPDMTGWTRVMYVIDGEVADIELLQPSREHRIAVLTSSPKIVVWDGSTDVPFIGMPWNE
jgi:hypothetical protein